MTTRCLKVSFIFFSVLFCFLPFFHTLEAQQGKSIEEYKRLLAKNPADVSALNNLGAALIQSGKYQEATDYLIKAAKIQPSNGKAHFNLGLAYQYLQKYKEAANEYQASIQYGFKTYKVCYDLGLVLEQSGSLAEAKSWYSESIKMKSDFANAYYNLAGICNKLNQKKDAVVNYKRYLEYNSNTSDKSEVQNIVAGIEKELIPPVVAKDESPPDITLMKPVNGSESGQTIETEQYEITIAGNAIDSNAVSKLTINEKNIPLPQGPKKEILFSEKMFLRLGRNEIKISAFDDNKNRRDFVLNVTRLESDMEPPQIVLLEPVTRGIAVKKRETMIEVQSENIRITGLADDKSGVARISVNNRDASIIKASEEEKSKFPFPENTVKFQSSVPLSLGSNEIIISGIDVKGNSRRDTLRVFRKRGEIVSKFYTNSWAILVGINEFQKEPWRSASLNYAAKDAIDMTKVLKDEFGFKKENITLLLDKRSMDRLDDRNIAGAIDRATLTNIRNSMSLLTDTTKVKQNDRVLIFFAGHGHTMALPDGGEMGFIIPEDGGGSSLGDYYNTSLPMREINDRSMMIPAKHVLFLVDACYSGLTAATRSKHSSFGIERLAELKVKELITAGLAEDQVIESPTWGHSAFTFKLLDALKTGSADTNGDGYITSDELAVYLGNTVPELAEGRQTPRHSYFFGDGEFIFELPR